MSISQKELIEKLKNLQSIFDSNELTYERISKIIQNYEKNSYKTSIEMYQDLAIISDHNEMPQFAMDYLDLICNRMKLISNQDLKIEKEIIEQEKSIEKIINDLNARGIYIDSPNKKEIENLDSYKERKEYLDKIKKETEELKKTEDSLKNEKEVGEGFDEDFIKGEESLNGLKKVQDDAENNKKVIVNPSIEQVNSVMDFYSSRQYESTYNVKVKDNKEQDNIEVEISYKGEQVSEKEPKYLFVFTDKAKEEFENKGIYEIVNTFDEESPIDKSIEISKNTDEYIAEDGSELEIDDMDNKNEVKDYINGKQKSRKNNNVRVRKYDNHAGKSNVILLTISFLLIMLSIILVILMINK